MQYKVVEIANVTDEELEKALNHWTAEGWTFESMHFAMRESSKRPSMAFLTFTRADRELNIRRIGYVASEVTRHGGICVAAAIAPYRAARADARNRVEGVGKFYEIHVSTPLQVCEQRDPKGLYKKARRGEIKGFTGVDDPFEAPERPELSIDTSKLKVEESVERILALPIRDGLLVARGK